MNSSLGGQPARDGILSLDMHLQSEPLLEDLRSPRKVGAEARGLEGTCVSVYARCPMRDGKGKRRIPDRRDEPQWK